jgi:AraC-like DNA-binding protein
VRYREDVAYEAFRSDAIGPKHWSLLGETQRHVRRLVYEMLSAGEQMALEEAAFALIDLLAISSSAPAVPSRTQRIADQVRERIHQQVGAKDTLQEIAAAVAYSPFHLARCFRAQTGVTIHQYRQGARLALGLERLRFSDEPITEIALELGFYDHSHFAAAFIRAFGATPSSVRASTQAGPHSRLRT